MQPDIQTETSIETGGVWGRSSQYGEEAYVIFSSHTPVAEVMMFLTMHDIGYHVLLGSWENTPEVSFICNRKYLNDLKAAGLLDRQHCVLELGKVRANDQRAGFLVYGHGGIPKEGAPAGTLYVEPIGPMKAITKQDAFAGGDFTHDPALKTFFRCGPYVPPVVEPGEQEAFEKGVNNGTAN